MENNNYLSVGLKNLEDFVFVDPNLLEARAIYPSVCRALKSLLEASPSKERQYYWVKDSDQDLGAYPKFTASLSKPVFFLS